MTLLAQAAADVPRVLREPAPTPFLVGFGRDGINLELGFWIEDAVSGTWRAHNHQLQYLASLFRARHHYCAPATRGAHRRSGKRRNAAPVKPHFAPRQGMRQCPGNCYRLDCAQKIPICYKHLESFK
ncbi:small-conductance mechanosensitive channel [Paraburkholderia sp. CI3]